MKLPEWLILWVWQSLIGEIYPEIRAIVLRYDVANNLLIRYYLDREPTEDDFDSLDCVITNILAHTSSNEEIKDVKEEAVFSRKRLADLDLLNGLVYARKEYSPDE
ncbi:colicin [Candidatus Thiomargarita nelsonii]|uniref:Colicin n=1 Tax=Candidatus Thiomargarita nelsonii TaxID=1003181 RepID=A0A4E0RCN1_9GAMM|nr:colicin [Candidatus Thiomargarita nelsonii]